MIKPNRRTRTADMALGTTPAPKKQAHTDSNSLWELSEKDPRWLLKLLDETIEHNQSLWDKPRRYFRGSAAGEMCIRALTLDAMGHRVPFEARVMRIFRTGNSIEDVNVEAMKAAGVFVSAQNEVKYDDPPVLGHVDAILKRLGTNEQMLCEIKSIKQELFKRLPKEHGAILAGESALNKGYYKGYLQQWNTYAWAKEIDIEIGFLLFEAKNEQQQKIYWLLRDPDMLESMLKLRKKAAPYVLSNPMRVAPTPTGFDPNDQSKGNACGWCDRRYLCKKISKKGCDYDTARAEDAKVRG